MAESFWKERESLLPNGVLHFLFRLNQSLEIASESLYGKTLRKEFTQTKNRIFRTEFGNYLSPTIGVYDLWSIWISKLNMSHIDCNSWNIKKKKYTIREIMAYWVVCILQVMHYSNLSKKGPWSWVIRVINLQFPRPKIIRNCIL